MYKRILAPVDGSPTSNQGLEEAVALARDQKAELRLIHVIDALVWSPDLIGISHVSEVPAFLRKRGEKILEEGKARAVHRGVDAQTVLHEAFGGRVAETIIKEVHEWEANIIVMGTHGHRGLGHLVLGSDAQAVVQGAPVPVLLVRGVER